MTTDTKQTLTLTLKPASDVPLCGMYGWVLVDGDRPVAKVSDRQDGVIIAAQSARIAALEGALAALDNATRGLLVPLRARKGLVAEIHAAQDAARALLNKREG